MKLMLQIVVIMIILLTQIQLFSQNFSWYADSIYINDTPGSFIVFHTYLVNNTTSQIELRVIRTINNLPPNWTSSFCVGGINGICYNPIIDTVPDPVVVNASSQFELAIDVHTSSTPEEGDIKVRVEDWRNPSEFLTESFVASTFPSKVGIYSFPITGEYQLYSNYPNPFNPYTHVPFEIGGAINQRTIVFIYNVMGQRVKKLLDEYLNPGLHQVSWDGRDAMGHPVSSGIYFIEVRTQDQMLMGKMFLLK